MLILSWKHVIFSSWIEEIRQRVYAECLAPLFLANRDIFYLDRIVAMSTVYTFSEAHRPSNFSMHIRFFSCSPERKLRITADIKFKFLEMVSNVYRSNIFRQMVSDGFWLVDHSLILYCIVTRVYLLPVRWRRRQSTLQSCRSYIL